MNLGALRQRVNRRTGVSVDQTELTADINEAIQIITSERAWYWVDGLQTLTIVEGTAAYSLPADWSQTRNVIVNGQEARRIDITDGDAFDFYDDQGTFHYSIENSQIVLYPTPGDWTVTHRYVKNEPFLSSDSDTPLMPPEHHPVICDLAAAMVLERMGDSRSQMYRTLYDKGIRRMASGRASHPQRIRVRSGYPI